MNGGRTVKLSVIALDYDGTIARETSGPRSVTPIAWPARGIVVLLVTGRILDELRAWPVTCTSSTASSPRTAR